MNIKLTVLLIILFSSKICSQDTITLSKDVSVFVENYCLECHDEDTEKGDRAFEDFLDSPNDPKQHYVLEEILDQLNLGEMPPEKKNVKQPSHTLHKKIVREITTYLSHVASSKSPSTTILRRLTNQEYRNTIRDLLGVYPEYSDATRLFQFEERHHGFKKNSSVQNLSNYQVEQYIKAGKFYLDQALVFNQQQPKKEIITFSPEDFNGREKIEISVNYTLFNREQNHIDIGHGNAVSRHPTYLKKFSKIGVPEDGRYIIRIKATSVGKKHPYDPAIYNCDLNKPLEMALWHVPNASLLVKGASEGRVFIDTFQMSDNKPKVYTAETWMPKGSSPFIHWINGPGSSKSILNYTQKNHHPETNHLSNFEIDQLEQEGIKVTDEMRKTPSKTMSDVYLGPRIRVYSIEIEGPIHNTWPPKSHQNIVGQETKPEKVNIDELVLKFCKKAFRGAVGSKSIQHYSNYIKQKIEQGSSKEEAIKLGLAAILSSPRFLFIDEGNSEKSITLTETEKSNRFSYMLWNSIPDHTTQNLVKENRFNQSLASELDRYLNHKNSKSFIKSFSDAWFRLDKIGQMPPSKNQFPFYFKGRLDSAMKQETYSFLEHLIKQNRPITELITAEYSFINQNLAKHYGLNNINSTDFKKVNLPASLRRNGILGHASILTATANGVETSPVLRGIWVLESLLGTPPSPPPPDVPAIEPDTRGATTIREQLEKHRQVAACADCHANIDPWGFALENFDPIGGLRTTYPIVKSNGKFSNETGPIIDSSGTTQKGEKLKNEYSLRSTLLNRKKQLTKNYLIKLLTYGTGRELNFRDHPEINAMTEQAIEKSYGMKELLGLAIESQIFNKR